MTMAYVAVDPKQPGAAYAVIVDEPERSSATAREIAREISKWIRKGDAVDRVTVEQAREMLAKWVRPPKAKQDELF